MGRAGSLSLFRRPPFFSVRRGGREGGGERRGEVLPSRPKAGKRERKERESCALSFVVFAGRGGWFASFLCFQGEPTAPPKAARSRGQAGGQAGRDTLQAWAARSETTSGLASVEISPKSEAVSPATIFFKIRRIILPERVLGSTGAHWR